MQSAEIVRLRFIGVAMLRIVSLIVFLFGFVPALSWLNEGLRDGDLLELTYYFPRILTMATLFVVGIVGLLGAPRIVTFVTPVSKEVRCPGCRYPLTSTCETCPECGLEVASLWTTAGAWTLEDAAWRARVLLLTATLVRLLAIVGVIYAAMYAIWQIVIWAIWWNDLGEGSLAYAASLFWPVILTAICLGAFIRAEAVAMLCMPRAKIESRPSQTAAGGDHVSGEPSDDDANEHRPTG